LIHVVRETGSTSADLAARLRAGEFVAEGDRLVADRQTAGRGRQGREWAGGSGNFMGSTVVYRRFGDPEPATLALAAGLAVYEAVKSVVPAEAGTAGSQTEHSIDEAGGPGSGPGRRLMLKWPNDVVVGAAKLAGILLEREGEAVLVGIGVNLALAPQLPDRETVSLADLGRLPDRDAFAAALARLFDLEIERWRNFGMGPIVQRWLAAAHPLGTPLRAGEPGDMPLTGTFAGLTEGGALQLHLADGSTTTIHAGEVHFAAAPR
jgi:BirA family biotin operon repressor/biotin-[acetyl-CoA-carboxylase] ligase